MADIPVCLRSVRMDLMRGSQPSSRQLSGPSWLLRRRRPHPCLYLHLSPTASTSIRQLPVPRSCPYPPPLPPPPASPPIPHPCSLSPAPAVTPPPAVTPIPTKTTQKWHLSEGHRRAKLEATPRPDCHADNSACRYIGTCALANLAAQKPDTRHPAAAPAFIPSQSGSRRLAVQVPGARQQTPSSRQITTYPPNRIHQEKT